MQCFEIFGCFYDKDLVVGYFIYVSKVLKFSSWKKWKELIAETQILISQGSAISDFAEYTNYWPQYISKGGGIFIQNLIWSHFFIVLLFINMPIRRIHWKNDKRFSDSFPKWFPLLRDDNNWTVFLLSIVLFPYVYAC